MRDRAGHGVRRDQERRDARARLEDRAVSERAAFRRRDVVIVAVRLIIGDDDRALRPVRAVGDVADRPRRQGFGDLLIRVGRVIVVADERVLDRRGWIHRHEPVVVVIASAEIENASILWQRPPFDRVEEILGAVQVGVQDFRIVGEIGEILRRVVMQDVAAVRGGRAGRIRRRPRRLEGVERVVGVETLLIPTPVHRAVEGRDLADVLLHVEQIGRRIRILLDDLLDIGSHERERLGGEGEIERRGGRVLVEVIRRLDLVGVEVRAREGSRIGYDGNVGVAVRRRDFRAKARAQHVRESGVGVGYRRPLVRVQSPLRLPGLPGDDRNRVRGRRPDDRLTEIVKKNEVLRPAPHERDRVAVDMADVDFGLLRLRQRDRGRRGADVRDNGARGVRRQTLLIHRIAVIGGNPGPGVDVEVVGHALVAVIDGNFVRRVDWNDLAGANDRLGHQERRDGFGVERRIEIALGETRGLVGRREAPGRLEKTICARVGPKEVVE